MKNNKFKVVIFDQRGLRYNAGYYSTLDQAKKWFDRIVCDQYWKNNSIRVTDAKIEILEDF